MPGPSGASVSFSDLSKEGYGDGYGYGYGYGNGNGDGFGFGFGEVIGNIAGFDVCVPFPGYVKVGCQVHTLEHWRANWRVIADKHEIEVYGSDVEAITQIILDS